MNEVGDTKNILLWSSIKHSSSLKGEEGGWVKVYV